MQKYKNRSNFFSLDLKNYSKCNDKNIKKTIDILNKDRLIIINGLKNTGKINFIKEFINTTKSNNNYFYFNKSNDIYNFISDNISIQKLLNDYTQLYKKPFFIILQNVNKIDNIKKFISKIYKEKYKILLVGNNIKIGGIKEVEILNNIYLIDNNLIDIIKYGTLSDIKNIDNNHFKENILKLLTNDIFLNDIFNNFGVKNINLYNLSLTYLSEINIYLSLRELHRNINSINNISLKTLIDYIEFSIQVKIIKRVYLYDFKKNKSITTKAKYYFTDNGIRNSLSDFKLNKKILIENLIFNILEYNNYTIYGGLNGKFNFTFYGIRDNENIFIHISKEEKKEDIKKEVRKLLKVGIEGKKYLLVDSLEKLGIKKVNYDSVEIVEVDNFLERF